MKKVTMTDIAKIAGVSIKTVSRVINNSNAVKEETREKVLKVIKEQGYQVNLLAKGLRKKQTNTIIVFIDKHSGGYWSIWHNEIVQEIIKEAKKEGYKTIISPSSGVGVLDDDTDGFYLLKSGMADGAIIFDNIENDIRIKYLKENDIPFVIVGKDMDYNDTCYVDLDNYQAGYIGGKHLIEKGYKKICFMLGNKGFVVNKERTRGFEDACNEVECVQAQIIYDTTNMETAYKNAIKVLETNKPDAFFISGDERALGVYRAIKEKGLTIPKDVAVLGIDNIPLCDYIYPSLSSIDQPKKKFGQHCIDILVKLINSNDKITKRVFIKPRLTVREST
ncbi:LacI family DNA-binding transcriptional regulator [Caldisalinibacter kiritimatiensis]|uniref:Regulatory protein, LacI:Periplasmic binding protein/LacI transcriptional regulator n=1 Tax=Caldisalinibacter kiritimatiensis TaxID=1304284 RepID=R1CE00_9FIRM|nr:LacI family DNA-binding transcriptional regulator [Caldisalinibacter kiritimatiensis]EOD00490.1 regulatory protein, LacI:Periplasmic binding protein/LacI transcriptional regulator [Caldisalinibacter kiritimatiensis]